MTASDSAATKAAMTKAAIMVGCDGGRLCARIVVLMGNGRPSCVGPMFWGDTQAEAVLRVLLAFVRSLRFARDPWIVYVPNTAVIRALSEDDNDLRPELGKIRAILHQPECRTLIHYGSTVGVFGSLPENFSRGLK